MKKRLVVLIASATMLFGVIAGAAASPILEKISANLNWSLKFEVDGKEWTPKDPAGNKLAAIHYNDSNYLPVRAISELFGIAVDFDYDTQKITLGEKTSEVAITNESVKLANQAIKTTDKQFTVQNGTDYGSGIVLNNINSAAKKTTLEPAGKYQTLNLQIFPLDAKDDIKVNIEAKDGTVLKQLNVSKSSSINELTVDIGGHNEVVIAVQSSPGNSDSAFVTGTYK